MTNIKKVVIIGPESTGKSTLAQNLAHSFNEPWVPEYARKYLENLNREYNYTDLLNIAKGQLRQEDQQIKMAQKVLFCDTNLEVVKVWSEHRFKKTHPWIMKHVKNRQYDLYLLTDIDMPWQEDPLREHPQPAMRLFFMDIYHQLLLEAKVPFVKISGNQEMRLNQATEAVNKLIDN